MVDDERMRLRPGERPVSKRVRFRTLGCYPLSGAIESSARNVQEIIDEMRSHVSAVQAVEGFGIDYLIDPRTTRDRLIEVLARAPARRVTRRPRSMPLAPITASATGSSR